MDSRYFKSALAVFNHILIHLDGDGNFVDFHNTGDPANLLYINAEDFLGKNYREVLPDYLGEELTKALALIDAGELSYSFDYQLVVNGEVKWFAATTTYAFPEEPIAKYFIIIKEISKRIKQSLLLKGVLDSTNSGVMGFKAVRDAENQIVDFEWIMVNKKGAALANRTQETLIGKRMLIEMPHNAPSGLFERYVAVVEKGEVLDIEFFYESDGVPPAWFHIVAVKYEDGFVGNFQDITAEKRAKDAHWESEKRYRTLFNDNPQPLWVFDIETFRFLNVNQAAIKHYGYSKEEFLRMTVVDIRAKEEIPFFMGHYNTPNDDSCMLLAKHLTRSGQEILVQIISHAILYKGRQARLVLAQDVTERKKAENQLKSQNEQLKQIAWIQSHQVRAPVANILGLTAIFNKTQLDDPLNLEVIQRIETAANQLDAVIHEIVRRASELE